MLSLMYPGETLCLIFTRNSAINSVQCGFYLYYDGGGWYTYCRKILDVAKCLAVKNGEKNHFVKICDLLKSKN